MSVHVDIVFIRLFIRFLLGFILLSAAISKLMHPKRFRSGIQDYQLIPAVLEFKFIIPTLLSFLIPLAEVLSGIGLIFLTLFLFVLFTTAIVINLVRGRRDLSCHCSGALGNHSISWWLVGRNGIFIVGLLLLLLTPPDLFTSRTILSGSSTTIVAMLLDTALPVLLLVAGLLVILVLINATRSILRSQ